MLSNFAAAAFKSLLSLGHFLKHLKLKPMVSPMARVLRAARVPSQKFFIHPKIRPPPYHLKPAPLGSRALEDLVQAKTYEGLQLGSVSESSGPFSALPSILAGLFGLGFASVAYADGHEGAAKPALPSADPSDHAALEDLAKNERRRLEELIKSGGIKSGSCPRFTVGVKGQRVTVKFSIPPTCEIVHIIANIVSHLGLQVKEGGAGSDMRLRACDSSVSWQLTLSDLDKQKESEGEGELPESKKNTEGNLDILISRSLIKLEKTEIEFIKQGSFADRELNALVSALRIAGETTGGNKVVGRKKEELAGTTPSVNKSASSLEALGVRVYGINGEHVQFSGHEISWGNIAGYEEEKRVIEDTVLLALHSPEVYDDIARRTQSKFESNRPRAVLFEGPPGTGKTSCARVIAGQAGVPLLYVPLEAIMSKWYGESERTLGKVFSLANEFPNGAIVFLDEVESFAASRDDKMHEATRRILSVLLRQIDGFEQDKKVVVIAATNRKQDLDPALVSRFDSIIKFDLPDQQTREAMAAQYAKHLTKSELQEFARATEGFSGRDMRDVCRQAQRHWASKIIRGQAPKDGEGTGLPPIEVYVESAKYRRMVMQTNEANPSENPN